MKKQLLIAAAGGIALLGAAPPPAAAPTAKTGYPPCSRTVTDNCIQLYERGVRTRENLAANAGTAPMAVARAAPVRTVTTAPAPRAKPVRLASREKVRRIRRAGERG